MTAIRKVVERPTDWVRQAEEIGSQLAARAPVHDAADTFVADGFALLKERGFFKAHVPAELGGHGAGYAEMCAAIRSLAKACGSTALAFAMHTHLVAVAAWRWRHQNAPTDGLLKRVAAEDLVLISSGGSDWLKSAGRAEKVEGGFRIDARKSFRAAAPPATF